MPGIIPRFGTFGRRLLNNSGAQDADAQGNEKHSNGASNGHGAEPNICDGTCNCKGCAKRNARLAGSTGAGNSANGPSATHEQTAASGFLPADGELIHNENQNGNANTAAIGDVDENLDGRRPGLRERLSNRVSQVGSALRARTVRGSSRTQSEDNSTIHGLRVKFDQPPQTTASGQAQSIYAQQGQASNPNTFAGVSRALEPLGQGNSTRAQGPLPTYTLPEALTHLYTGQVVNHSTVGQASNGQDGNDQSDNGQWTVVTGRSVGRTTVPTQAGDNNINGQTSIQATLEEGTNSASLLVPIPWDVGNDPDHHKVRSCGSAPLVHAGVPPSDMTQNTNGNSRSDYFSHAPASKQNGTDTNSPTMTSTGTMTNDVDTASNGGHYITPILSAAAVPDSTVAASHPR